jgi:hypothetical protein
MAKKSKEKLERARKDQNQHKSSKEQEKLKISTKAQNQHSPWNQPPLTLSIKALPLR